MEAHPLNMSRSALRVEQGLARFEMRLPLGELEHIAPAHRMLPDRFLVDGQPAVSKQCEHEKDEYVCRATFLAPEPKFVDCGLAAILGPEHVHRMHAGRATLVFSQSVTRQEVVEQPFPWWVLAVVLGAIALIGGSRWRRRIGHRG
jgi:hypothetical protein